LALVMSMLVLFLSGLTPKTEATDYRHRESKVQAVGNKNQATRIKQQSSSTKHQAPIPNEKRTL